MAQNSFENILGYQVAALSREACVDKILIGMESGERATYFACINPHSLEIAKGDHFFRQALQNADLLIPDGIGIIIASKILGGNIRNRVTGSDIFWGLCRAINERGHLSCFFLGSTDEALAKISEKMKVDFPSIDVAGFYSPPFKSEFSPDDDRLMIEAINRVKPDILWVGMTAPKQEKWVYKNRDQLNVKLIGPIGAVFDFYTGNVKRSHPIFRKIGLEWLPRFIREPRRLWRRNLISNPNFLLRMIYCKLESY